jgi:Homeodomain-like domain
MSMRTSNEQRQKFYLLHRDGHTYEEIAERFGVSKECIRYWCRRQRDGKGCETHYHRAPLGLLHRFEARVRYCVLRLRLEHPRRGPNRLLAELKERPSLRGLRLPSEASIGRYLHQWPRFRRKRKKKALRQQVQAPTAVHQRWQIDFKVGIRLKSGMQIHLHTVRDPVGEAYIGDFVFDIGKRQRRVKMEEVRATLRSCFARWGTLPDEIQTDGETVLVNPHQDGFPSAFTLWLKGLGIQHVVIHNVTSNAAVERCHRTVHDYALIGNEDQMPAELQRILDCSTYKLNFELPSRARGCAGQPPVVAHPDLLQPRRPFQPERELALFDLQRVDAYLATFTWRRMVDKNGRVALGKHHCYYSVGRAHAGHEVVVRFEPTRRQFIFAEDGALGTVIKQLPAKGLDISDLTGCAAWPSGPGAQQLLLPLFVTQGVNC